MCLKYMEYNCDALRPKKSLYQGPMGNKGRFIKPKFIPRQKIKNSDSVCHQGFAIAAQGVSSNIREIS